MLLLLLLIFNHCINDIWLETNYFNYENILQNGKSKLLLLLLLFFVSVESLLFLGWWRWKCTKNEEKFFSLWWWLLLLLWCSFTEFFECNSWTLRFSESFVNVSFWKEHLRVFLETQILQKFFILKHQHKLRCILKMPKYFV